MSRSLRSPRTKTQVIPDKRRDLLDKVREREIEAQEKMIQDFRKVLDRVFIEEDDDDDGL